MQLDEVLGLAAGAIERVVDEIGAACLERGDDETVIEAERSRLEARYDTAIVSTGDFGPAFCRIAHLGVAAQHRQRTGGTVDADIGRDDDRIGMQRPVAGKAEHVIHLVGLASRYDLGPAIITAAAQGDAGFGPVLFRSAGAAGGYGRRSQRLRASCRCAAASPPAARSR